MPELPDVVVYLEALAPRIVGRRLEGIRLTSPFLLRSVEPALGEAAGRRVRELRRLGKRLVFGLDDGFFLVLHLMIAGRLRFAATGAAVPGKVGLAAFDFETGALLLTEAGSKKRASLHLLRGEEALSRHDPGGLEVLDADLAGFRAALCRDSHTLKRALTDPRILSGIGNAYSDEILWSARLSPFRRTGTLDDDETERLWLAARETLLTWLERLRAEVGDGFPAKVTAFRKDMAVHVRFRKPCPRCGAPVQRIRYAGNEANYCPGCQTGGKVFADRALSRLLRGDWPRTLDELERRGILGGGGSRDRL